MSLLVQSRVHDLALKCSKRNRAGLFTRVSQPFIDDVEADLDNIIRRIYSVISEPLHPQVQPDAPEAEAGENVRLVSSEAVEKLRLAAEVAVRRLVQNRVQRTPSCGKTL